MARDRRPAAARREGPDRSAALEQYRRRAAVYDLELALFEPIRRQAIESLALRRGQHVLDLGCGTGLSLPLLRQAVGAAGQVTGVEQSPEMLERAHRRVAALGWRNVSLLCCPVEVAPLPEAADAALFHFTHDVLRRPEAVGHAMRHLRPGARVVATGLCWAPPWLPLVNLLVLPAALRSVSSLEGLRQPWSHLACHLRDLRTEPLLLGGAYLASGTVR